MSIYEPAIDHALKLVQVNFRVAYRHVQFKKGEFVGIGIRRIMENAFKKIICQNEKEDCNSCANRNSCHYYRIFCTEYPSKHIGATKPYRVRILKQEKDQCTCQLQILEPLIESENLFIKALHTMKGMAEYKLIVNNVKIEKIIESLVLLDVKDVRDAKKVKLALLAPLILKVKGKNTTIPKLNYVLINLMRKLNALANAFGLSKLLPKDELSALNTLLPSLLFVPFALNVKVTRVAWNDISEYPAIQGTITYEIEKLPSKQRELLLKYLRIGSYIGLGSLRVAGLGDYECVVYT
ncbi:MAG: CRISPR system precrRNA processing endoribonuclease RAMP protein Cas6 [Candidatus Baldrarchaeia archaeon]